MLRSRSVMKGCLSQKLKTPRAGILVTQLNVRLQPIHRDEFFEDALNEALDRAVSRWQKAGHEGATCWLRDRLPIARRERSQLVPWLKF
jgi:hypothetical protein